jgi:hypothetical protein
LAVHCINMVIKNNKSQLKIQVFKNPLRFLVPKFSKGQLKIQEMAFMLVAIVLFFVLAGLFVLSIIFSNLTESANTIAETRTVSALTHLSDSPELRCTGSRPNCVDADKLIVMVGNEQYERYWPFSSLRVIRSHAFNKSGADMISCSLENYPDCDMFEIYDKNVAQEGIVVSYIALCRKERENEFTYDHCEIARLAGGTKIRTVGDNS